VYHAASFFPEMQASSGLHFLIGSYFIVFCCINFWTCTSVSQILDLYIFRVTSSGLYIFCTKNCYTFLFHIRISVTVHLECCIFRHIHTGFEHVQPVYHKFQTDTSFEFWTQVSDLCIYSMYTQVYVGI
jgi:hypothetical protein